MSRAQSTLFDEHRMGFEEAIELTAVSLRTYALRYKHWAIAFSGGKDSSATVTVIAHLIETGRVPAPKSLKVLYADTRMEITPLQTCAMGVLKELEKRGIQTEVVLPELDDRFFVYMFGRGVPPPKNRFRWCTSQIKIEPMVKALAGLRDAAGEKFLMLTGVRLGESAARDQRIALSCSRDGAECGQGWFQEATPEAVADTLAPLIHWRVCFVWDWLFFNAPALGFPTADIATAYGGDEAEEINARTGCVGCNLASKDNALEAVLKSPAWAYLHPFRRLRPLYTELIRAENRKRKDGSEKKKDGTLVSNPMRLGPLTMEARRYGIETVLGIQNEINSYAVKHDRPEVSLINEVELARIEELIAANTWPQRWTGDEPSGDVILPEVMRDGSIQHNLL
jgi:DNA sulfur modification protein DndC